MFDDFPDLVTVEVVTGEDNFGNPITTSSQVNARIGVRIESIN